MLNKQIRTNLMIIIYLAISLLCISCKRQPPMTGPKKLDIMLVNTGKRRIFDSYASLGECKSIGGGLGPGANKMHLSINCPLTEYALVFFKYENGKSYTKKVLIKGAIPETITGQLTLIFNIDSNTNTVKLEYELDRDKKIYEKYGGTPPRRKRE